MGDHRSESVREQRVRRRTRWLLVGLLLVVALLLPGPDLGVRLLELVVVTMAVLWAFAPQRLGREPLWALLAVIAWGVVATIAHGDLPLWAPGSVVVLLVVAPFAVGILDEFLQGETKSDRTIIGWFVWGWTCRVLRVAVCGGTWIVVWRTTDDESAAVFLAPVAVATAAGWPSIGLIVLALVTPFVGGSTGWWALGTISAFVAVSHRPVRPPRRSVDLPSSSQLVGRGALRRRVARIDRTLSRNEWADAEQACLQAMTDPRCGGATTTIALRLAQARLELTDLQGALDALGLAWPDATMTVRAAVRRLQGEILARSAQPEAALAALDEARRLLPYDGRHQARVSLAASSALIDLHRFDEAAHQASTAKALLHGPGVLIERFRGTRLLATAQWKADRIDLAKAALDDSLATAISSRWIRQYMGIGGRGRDDQAVMFGDEALMLVEFARTELLEVEMKLDPRLSPDTDDVDEGSILHNLEMYSIALDMAGANLDLADAELLTARICAGRGHDKMALEASLAAVAELDAVRHRLRAQADRVAWAAKFNEALAMAQEVAAGSGNSVLVAELVELARVQAFPLLGTGGVDDVALQAPPTVRVRGRAGVARGALTPPTSEVRPPIDLEHAAACAAGPEAWWLSYWHDGTGLIWALVPPNGSVEHGRLLGDRFDELQAALRELDENLPIRLDDEADADVDLRLFAAPFRRDPRAEALISSQLGRLLLPKTLRRHALERYRSGRQPLAVAIAPDPLLAHVPWALLAVDQSETEPALSVRLCETARWTLAPSATLTVLASDRPMPKVPAPLGLAVLDPADVPALPAARSLSERLTDVPVLGGRHWGARLATPAEVLSAMARAGPTSSVLFGCHATQGDPGRPSSSALVLAGEDERGAPQRLSAAMLFSQPLPPEEFPAQVSLQACDTSDLRSAGSGEWLSLAPAFLAAGARVVGTTQFPLVDVAIDAEQADLTAALLRGEDLAESIRRLHLHGLERWRAVDRETLPPLEVTPLAWAAHCVISTGRAESHEGSAPLRVDVRAIECLTRSAKSDRPQPDRTVTSGRVVAVYLDLQTELLTGSLLREISSDLLVELTSRLLRAERAPGDLQGVRPSGELLAAARRAGALAASTGWLQPEHLVAAVLDGPSSPGRTVIRVVTRQKGTALRRTLRSNLRSAETRGATSRRDIPSELCGFVDEMIDAAQTGARDVVGASRMSGV